MAGRSAVRFATLRPAVREAAVVVVASDCGVRPSAGSGSTGPIDGAVRALGTRVLVFWSFPSGI
jgi:hypothetical protein